MPKTQEIFEFGRLESTQDYLLWGAILAVFLIGVWGLYRRDMAGRSGAARWLLTLLRAAVFVLLMFVFLDPRTRVETTLEHPSRVAVVSDLSLSMSIADRPTASGEPREARAAKQTQALTQSTLLERLRKTHQVSIYGIGKEADRLLFLDRLPKPGEADAAIAAESAAAEPVVAAPDGQPTPDGPLRLATADAAAVLAERLTPRADQTRIGDTLAKVITEESTVPLAGVIVFSDGAQNAGGPIEAAIRIARREEVPIYVVPIGSALPAVNLRASDLQMPSRLFAGDETQVTAYVQGLGLSGGSAQLELLVRPADNDDEAVSVESKTVALPDDGAPLAVPFTFLPKDVGNWEMVLRIEEQDGELRNDDNQAVTRFEIIDQKTRVLVVTGGPSREYQFLRNMLFRDKSVELTVLLQTGQDPLAQEADHLLAALPTSVAAFAEKYDVVVAIDPNWLESSISVPAQDALIEWISTQAGGLTLVAGPIHTPRLARADDNQAPIRKIFPVVLKDVFTSDLDRGLTDAWRLDFTPDGKATPYLRLVDDGAASAKLWSQFPGFYFTYPVASVKPGASVFATYSDPRALVGGAAPPAMAGSFYGAGRVFYVGSSELWRLRRLGEGYHDRLWVRIIRHLAQGRMLQGSSRGSILLESERYLLAETVPVRVSLLDESYQPLAIEQVSLSITDPGKNLTTHILRPEPGRPGVYLANFTPLLAGEFRLQLLVPGTTEIVEQRLYVKVPDFEFDNPRLDQPLLERLASETGGRLVELREVDEIPSMITDHTETSVVSGTPRPLWDRSWLMFALVALLGLEWTIRKILTLA